MEDSNGLYYLPNPSLTAVRVYVRRGGDGGVEFRMWDAEHPEVWERHGWIGMDVINAAAELFAGSHEDNWKPAAIYDTSIAEVLLREKERSAGRAGRA